MQVLLVILNIIALNTFIFAKSWTETWTRRYDKVHVYNTCTATISIKYGFIILGTQMSLMLQSINSLKSTTNAEDKLMYNFGSFCIQRSFDISS